MDYKTASSFLIDQGLATAEHNPEAFLVRLQLGKPPIPGQVTSILLALKVIFDALKGSTKFERQLVCALHLLAFDSRQLFDSGKRSGIVWPPLLDEDVDRIAVAVKNIFSGVWQP